MRYSTATSPPERRLVQLLADAYRLDGALADEHWAEDAEGADASRPLSAVRADGDRVVDAAMEMSVERFNVLFRELRQARELMRSVEG